MTRGHHFEENLTPCGAPQAVLPRRATQHFVCVYLLSNVCQLFVRGQTHQSSVMCGCTRNGAARNKKKQNVKASRWKMEAASRRQPACESEPAGGGTQQATASRREPEASRRQPAYESGHARGGSQRATASRREQEASRRKSAGGRWMPAGDSQQARENRQANQREQEASRRKSAGGRWMPAGDRQQAREREQTS